MTDFDQDWVDVRGPRPAPVPNPLEVDPETKAQIIQKYMESSGPRERECRICAAVYTGMREVCSDDCHMGLMARVEHGRSLRPVDYQSVGRRTFLAQALPTPPVLVAELPDGGLPTYGPSPVATVTREDPRPEPHPEAWPPLARIDELRVWAYRHNIQCTFEERAEVPDQILVYLVGPDRNNESAADRLRMGGEAVYTHLPRRGVNITLFRGGAERVLFGFSPAELGLPGQATADEIRDFLVGR